MTSKGVNHRRGSLREPSQRSRTDEQPACVLRCRGGTMGLMSDSQPQTAPSSAPGRLQEKPRVSSRIGGIAESATLAVDAKAKALKAAGRPVIGFGAGEADFPTPAYIVEAAVAACSDPASHRYTPAGGLPALKQAIAADRKSVV